MDPEGRGTQTSTSPDGRGSPLKGERAKQSETARNDLSQQISSIRSSFFTLPIDIRNDIYKRVLVLGHSIFLFQDTGSQVVESFAPERPVRWLNILFANRQVHDEASAILYGSNHFTFMDTTQYQGAVLHSFLDCIGPAKANLLTHLCINFPIAEVVESQPGKFKLRDNDLDTLSLLQDKCNKLTTLEILIHSQNSKPLMSSSDDDSLFIREAISQVDARLRSIASLNTIIVRSYDGTPSLWVKELMQGLGWILLLGDKVHRR